LRSRINLEAFDAATLWPARTFDGYIAAEAAGYKRSSIALCVKGDRQQHAGHGWRDLINTALLSTEGSVSSLRDFSGLRFVRETVLNTKNPMFTPSVC
jgi:hypothetical protein